MESIQDAVSRALLNKDYPTDYIIEVWEDIDQECALNIMIESHREKFNDMILDLDNAKDIFVYLIQNNQDFQSEYIEELESKWIESCE